MSTKNTQVSQPKKQTKAKQNKKTRVLNKPYIR